MYLIRKIKQTESYDTMTNLLINRKGEIFAVMIEYTELPKKSEISKNCEIIFPGDPNYGYFRNAGQIYFDERLVKDFPPFLA